MSTEKVPKINTYLAQRTNSESFLNTQNDEYNTFLSDLRDYESLREDKVVKIRDLMPVDLSKDGKWIIEYPSLSGKDQYTLNDQSIGQLGNKRSRAAFSRAYGYSIPEKFTTTDLNGNPTIINLRETLFTEAMRTRPEAKGVFRQVYEKLNTPEEHKIVKGVVGENYPLDFQDSEILDQIYKKSVDLGLNPKPAHFNHYDTGAVRASFMFDNDEFVFENKDSKDNFGIFYKNSSYGDSAMGGGSYVYTQICTNGMMGWKSRFAFRINHSTRKSFIKNILEKITRFRRSEEFKLFSTDYGIDDIHLFGDGTHYSTFDRIYPEIAVGLIFKAIQGSKFLRKSYERAMKIVVKDWRKELEAQVKKHSLGTKKIPTLQDLAVQDNTLNMYQKEGNLYDIAGILTSAGNLYSGEPAVAFQEAAMQVLTGKNLTPLLKVSQ